MIEAAGAGVVACDVEALAADLIAVEALVRLQLTARRLGSSIRLRGAPHELVALLRLCGLNSLFDR
jgi:ABC-type transporter Mla MlaB component